MTTTTMEFVAGQEPVTMTHWCYAIIYKHSGNKVILHYDSEQRAIACREADFKDGNRVSEIVKQEYIIL